MVRLCATQDDVNRHNDCTTTISRGINRPPHPDHLAYTLPKFRDHETEKMLFVEVLVWVFSRLYRRVHDILHGCADNLIGDLVVVAAELFEGCLFVAADLAFILVLADTEGCR